MSCVGEVINFLLFYHYPDSLSGNDFQSFFELSVLLLNALIDRFNFFYLTNYENYES